MSADDLVTVVVLSYNRPKLLSKCLEALSRQTYSPLQVLVIDNRSPSSKEISEVIRTYPRFRLIQNSRNTGFTGGMNQGLCLAEGKYVCFTEDDIVLAENYVQELVRYHDKLSTPALLGGLQLNYFAGTVRCSGGSCSLGGIYRATIDGSNMPADQVPDQPYRTEFLPGSMMFGRTDLLRRLHGFRRDFFMYFVDRELCLRMIRLGIPIILVPSARAWHIEPCSETVSEAVEFHKTKNFVAMYLLHAPWHVLPEFFARYGIIGTVRYLFNDPKRAFRTARAWIWNIFRLPTLLKDRSELFANGANGLTEGCLGIEKAQQPSQEEHKSCHM